MFYQRGGSTEHEETTLAAPVATLVIRLIIIIVSIATISTGYFFSILFSFFSSYLTLSFTHSMGKGPPRLAQPVLVHWLLQLVLDWLLVQHWLVLHWPLVQLQCALPHVSQDVVHNSHLFGVCLHDLGLAVPHQHGDGPGEGVDQQRPRPHYRAMIYVVCNGSIM